MGKQWKQWETLFSWALKSLQMVTAAMKLKDACSLEEKLYMTNLDSVLKSRDMTLLTKVCLIKAMVFSIVMYGCESWTIKTAECQRIDAFELWCWKTLESPLDCKEIKPVHPKGNQPWIFIHWKDWCWRWSSNTLATWCEGLTHCKKKTKTVSGKDWRQEEKGMTEDEMVGWHHWLTGHEFEQTQRESEGQGSLGTEFMGSKSQTWLSDWTTTVGRETQISLRFLHNKLQNGNELSNKL